MLIYNYSHLREKARLTASSRSRNIVPRGFAASTARRINRSIRRRINVELHMAKHDPERDINDGRDGRVLNIAHGQY